jgi:hypothetical protein
MAVLFLYLNERGSMNVQQYEPNIAKTLIGMGTLVSLLWLLAFLFH